jgi:hypothetical protein
LSELKSVTGPMGLHIERDLWFRPTPVRELPEYKERWGDGGPYSIGPYPGKPLAPDQPPDSSSLSEPGSTEIPHQLEGSKLSAASLPKENAAGSAAPIRELPDGWTAADIHFLLERLAEGPILVAESGLGIPTIHNNFGAETRHLGFGLMQVEGDNYTLRFDAGGAMQHSPSGKSWTRLTIEGQYKNYDPNTVRQTLLGWLLPESNSEEIQPWQMTRLAYQKSKALQVAEGIPVLPKERRDDVNGADGEEHAHLVRAALARGEPVPAEVLADYPDLLPVECDSPISPIRLTYGDNGRQMFFEGEHFMVLNPYLNHAEKRYASGWVWFQRNESGEWHCLPDPNRGEHSQVGAFSLQEALAYAERVLNLRFELVGAPEDLPDSYPLPPQWESDPAPDQRLASDFADPSKSRPVFTKQVTGAAAAKLLAEAAALVPEMSGVGDDEQPASPVEPTEFERWELALLTGMLNKRDSAFHRSLKVITQPETLQLALDRIPRTDTQRRTLVEQRLEILSG